MSTINPISSSSYMISTLLDERKQRARHPQQSESSGAFADRPLCVFQDEVSKERNN
jgi:hypothetical protein